MKEDWVDRWKGGTVVCIASGPSLAEADCERARSAGLPTIVTNTTFKRCLWADVLFGFDGAWWGKYRAEVDAEFKGRRVTCSQGGRRSGDAELVNNVPWFTSFHNSGANAISLAITGGAIRIVLLGFDCQKLGGQVHWHGDHPDGLSNARSLKLWPKHFKNVARLADQRRVDIVNCSRATALTCFRRAPLEDVL